MAQLTRKLTIGVPTLLLSLLAAIVAGGCGTPSDSEDSNSLGSGGTTTATGGTSPGTGGVTASGGATGPGGVTTGTGGAVAGTGGVVASGGATTGTGGAAATGGATTGTGGVAATGGAGTGGTTSAGPVFHIFMLMGQSNMAGVAKRQDSDKNTDPRVKVWGGCGQPAGQWNTVTNPPLNDCPGEKGWNLSDSVDPGIWFAKTLLPALPEGDTIGLVGTAESGESINTFITGGSHHQMILNKIAGAKTAANARFAGVIFHQGESDNTQSTWPAKVVQLYNEVKQAWGVSYDVPFILGELPAGGCCSAHNTRVHEAADLLPDGYWIPQTGTAVMDEYHFDHASVVLMGTRYGEKMIEALGW